MTRKKQSKDTPVMKSGKKGYSLIDNKEMLSLHMTIDYLAHLLSEEWKGDKKKLIYKARETSWEFIDQQDDNKIEEQANEIINHLANPDE
ncbi:hypothetical protein H6G54_22160 [Anabaena cylindrica FACHB-243]|uniref:Uncharacterized protein n=1 Tax=Anabaena cylindrica (strain ATCC 27899 / PCC 7122) TaxID=272123 RepID=K9ZH17_ANACC|nr:MULTISPECIES: hypothetical protein [Anabaena]AFZ57645.1 hypothetical protein Anacy_2180 [Anabaena cylindrica PCC 7122]AZL96677.1 hypothetical protein [Anabaena sp. CCAP 1446/1C]MBD2420357.1 hypothetical protein [Anabaena cylindrica FACHB-243]MBY5285730.1 hypothetical protein [Anabaena sp. CCAP 1446/1C]MBY5310517.1 hypothetical protein [Anabaena sp. CCAP 1446/1C]